MKYHRVCIQLFGYAVVPGDTVEEALENAKKLTRSDFDFEDVTEDVLEGATVIEECTELGSPVE